MKKKSEVWYDASYDEIWEVNEPYKIIRGQQALIQNGINPTERVPDFLGLFFWKINKRLWNGQKKLGWLIKLGDL